jgi:hypothetical protein
MVELAQASARIEAELRQKDEDQQEAVEKFMSSTVAKHLLEGTRDDQILGLTRELCAAKLAEKSTLSYYVTTHNISEQLKLQVSALRVALEQAEADVQRLQVPGSIVVCCLPLPPAACCPVCRRLAFLSAPQPPLEHAPSTVDRMSYAGRRRCCMPHAVCCLSHVARRMLHSLCRATLLQQFPTARASKPPTAGPSRASGPCLERLP